MTHNPFIVACPDCEVPAGQRCRIGNRARIPNDDGTAVHQARTLVARLRLSLHGSCALCGRLMIQMTEPDETRHALADQDGPIPPCPPHPTEALGIVPYYPSGVEQFVAYDVQPDPPADQPNPPPPVEHDVLPVCVEVGCPPDSGGCRYGVAGAHLAGSAACLTTDMGGHDPDHWTYDGYLERARASL